MEFMQGYLLCFAEYLASNEAIDRPGKDGNLTSEWTAVSDTCWQDDWVSTQKNKFQGVKPSVQVSQSFSHSIRAAEVMCACL
jgi:hypothetical protein